MFFLWCYHVFIVLTNQNNPTAALFRITGMHNEKTWFLKIVKNGVIYFCKFIYFFKMKN